jgi:hypothetical protein
MAGRVSALVGSVLFAWLLFIAFSDFAQLAQSGRLGFGDSVILLFCIVVSVGFIGFFLSLFWAIGRARR